MNPAPAPDLGTQAPPPPPRWRLWVDAARPKTLGAAFAPVLMGTALAYADGGLHLGAALCALLGAVGIQVGTNFSNDYLDYLKGADAERVGPVRATQAGLATPGQMRWAATLAFGAAVVAGLYLILRGGWPVLALGVVSIASGVLYTAGRYALAYTGLADLFVLVFFGPVAVGGTYYVQTLDLTGAVVLAGLAPGLLSEAILLVNNLRDQGGDARVRKRTLVVRWGRAFGTRAYAVSVLAPLLIPLGLVGMTGTGAGALAVWLLIPLMVRAIRTVWLSQDPQVLNPMLGRTGQLLLLYSVLFSIGWVLTA
ncbi:MAG: 1,4-dihydroxy-2-naphthoate polyprenyltransferase [Bacteroidota bacterium]